MKRSDALKSILVFSSLVVASGIAMASSPGNPTNHVVTIVCPYTHTGPNIVTNFGMYVAGFGSENILTQTNQVYFTSGDFGVPGVPDSLANYSNLSTDYNSARSMVTCTFQSSVPTDPNFSVNYYITNGFGGYINSQSNDTISLTLPVGLIDKPMC